MHSEIVTITSDDVAKVRNVVDVRQGAGNKYVSLSRYRQLRGGGMIAHIRILWTFAQWKCKECQAEQLIVETKLNYWVYRVWSLLFLFYFSFLDIIKYFIYFLNHINNFSCFLFWIKFITFYVFFWMMDFSVWNYIFRKNWNFYREGNNFYSPLLLYNLSINFVTAMHIYLD